MKAILALLLRIFSLVFPLALAVCVFLAAQIGIPYIGCLFYPLGSKCKALSH
jgi:hypothetical protein